MNNLPIRPARIAGPTDRAQNTVKLLERQWAWARLTMRWRLYRSGYRLHARGIWRRAHPPQREYQRRTDAYEMRQLMKGNLPQSQNSIFDDQAVNEFLDTMTGMRKQVEAETRRRQTEVENRLKQTAARRTSRKAKAPASFPSPAVPVLTGRELAQMHEAEAKILAARTQEIGAIAQTSLLSLLVGEDTDALEFQRQQMAELCDQLAPPGSRIEERLLAEVIVYARFETLLWQARAADLIATGQTHQTDHRRVTRNIGAIADKRAADAQKRYLQALRDLAHLRRTLGPAVQVNIANLVGEVPSQPANRVHTVTSSIDETSA